MTNVEQRRQKIAELLKQKNFSNELTKYWQLNENVNNEISKAAKSKIIDDGRYAPDMYVEDIEIDDFKNFEVSIEDVYTDDDLFFISGQASEEAEATVNASHPMDDGEDGFPESISYEVSGTYRFQIELAIDATKTSSKDQASFNRDIMDQMQNCDLKIEETNIEVPPEPLD